MIGTTAPLQTCMYPDCFFYSLEAMNYCCVACNCDHIDSERLKKEQEEIDG